MHASRHSATPRGGVQPSAGAAARRVQHEGREGEAHETENSLIRQHRSIERQLPRCEPSLTGKTHGGRISSRISRFTAPPSSTSSTLRSRSQPGSAPPRSFCSNVRGSFCLSSPMGRHQARPLIATPSRSWRPSSSVTWKRRRCCCFPSAKATRPRDVPPDHGRRGRRLVSSRRDRPDAARQEPLAECRLNGGRAHRPPLGSKDSRTWKVCPTSSPVLPGATSPATPAARTVMLSLPPRSFATSTRRLHAASRPGDVSTTRQSRRPTPRWSGRPSTGEGSRAGGARACRAPCRCGSRAPWPARSHCATAMRPPLWRRACRHPGGAACSSGPS